MNQFDGKQEFIAVLKKLEDVAVRKGHDYGGANFLGALEGSLKLGVLPSLGSLLRADQKWSRICTLISQGEATAKVDETVDETIEDMVNYLIYVLVLRKKERLPQQARALESPVEVSGAVKRLVGRYDR